MNMNLLFLGSFYFFSPVDFSILLNTHLLIIKLSHFLVSNQNFLIINQNHHDFQEMNLYDQTIHDRNFHPH